MFSLKILTYTEARAAFKKAMDYVCDSSSPIVITRQKGDDVVMLSLEDYNSLQASLSFSIGTDIIFEGLSIHEGVIKDHRAFLKREDMGGISKGYNEKLGYWEVSVYMLKNKDRNATLYYEEEAEAEAAYNLGRDNDD